MDISKVFDCLAHGLLINKLVDRCLFLFLFLFLFIVFVGVVFFVFFFLPLCCMFFFDFRILITPLVSSNSSYGVSDQALQLIHNYIPIYRKQCAIFGLSLSK